MAIGGVVINFMAKTKDAIKDVDALTRSIKKTGDQSDRTRGGMNKLGGVLKTGLAAGAVAAGYGLLQLGEFMIDAGKAAYEDQQQADKLRRTLEKIPGVTEEMIDANEDWIDSMELATHVSDTDLRKAVEKLTLSTGDLGEAQRIASVAADLATQSGKSYSSVVDAMVKAANGNTSALKRMAPWLDTNKDGAVDLTEAMKLLEGQYSDTAEAAADQDVWSSLKTIWGQLKEAIGQWLLPLLQRFSDWFKDPANKRRVQEMIDKVGDFSLAIGRDLVGAIGDMIAWFTSPKGQVAVARFKANIEVAIGIIRKLIDWIMSAIGWIDDLISKFAAIPGGRDAVHAAGAAAGAAGATAASAGVSTRAGATTTTTVTQPQTVIVTEEQVYRAITRLLKIGDARNGIVRVA